MNETIPLKHCNSCDKDLPATIAYFYQSYLTPKHNNNRGKTYPICRHCHNRGTQKNKEERKILHDITHPISEQEAMTGAYVPLTPLARRRRSSVAYLAQTLHEQGIPVFHYRYRNAMGGVVYVIARADAIARFSEALITTITETAPPSSPPSPSQLGGTPERCGSCGTGRGNILADLEKGGGEASRVQYGYLCMACYKLVREFGGDPARIEQVHVYLKATRRQSAARSHTKGRPA